jgi:hypothetical protein
MAQAIKADLGDHAPCDLTFPPKAIAHIMANSKCTAEAPLDLVPFAHLKDFFVQGGKGLAPHILWDPFTGAFAQFFPATSRSKSLDDPPGGTRTNRAGKVVVQIEALFFPHCRVDGKVFARLADTPCKGWSELNAWVRSWGVPDTWPMGPPTDFVSAPLAGRLELPGRLVRTRPCPGEQPRRSRVLARVRAGTAERAGRGRQCSTDVRAVPRRVLLPSRTEIAGHRRDAPSARGRRLQPVPVRRRHRCMGGG